MYRLLRLLPSCFVVVLLLALSVSACGEQEAFQAYEQGQHALARQRLQDARTHFDRALALDSSYAQAYLARGQISWEQQQYEQALPDLSRAIELDPHLVWAYYLRGASLMTLHQYEASLPDFERFLDSEQVEVPDRVRAHRWRGIALLNLERPDEALVDFSACITLQPDRAFNYKERAEIYEGMGQLAEAITDYAAYMARTDKDNEEALAVQHHLDSLRTVK